MSEQIPDGSEGSLVPQGAGPPRGRFDYTPLPPGVARRAQTAVQLIHEALRQTVANLVVIGNELLAVKRALPRGSFGPWLQAEFGWHPRTARRFMSVARRFGPNPDSLSELGIEPTAAYLLAAPSAPATAAEEALRRARGGEKITPAVAQEIIAAHRPGPAGEDVSPRPPVTALKRELLTLLETLRRRWDRKDYPVLARQLQDFLDSLAEK